jgi:hypothetical protein
LDVRHEEDKPIEATETSIRDAFHALASALPRS